MSDRQIILNKAFEPAEINIRTHRVVANAACLAAFSLLFGRAELIAAPARGISINSVNHFITEPPPK